MLTIAPLLCGIIAFNASLEWRKTPVQVTSMIGLWCK
jgi:hypothetical protein